MNTIETQKYLFCCTEFLGSTLFSYNWKIRKCVIQKPKFISSLIVLIGIHVISFLMFIDELMFNYLTDLRDVNAVITGTRLIKAFATYLSIFMYHLSFFMNRHKQVKYLNYLLDLERQLCETSSVCVNLANEHLFKKTSCLLITIVMYYLLVPVLLFCELFEWGWVDCLYTLFEAMHTTQILLTVSFVTNMMHSICSKLKIINRNFGKLLNCVDNENLLQLLLMQKKYYKLIRDLNKANSWFLLIYLFDRFSETTIQIYYVYVVVLTEERLKNYNFLFFYAIGDVLWLIPEIIVLCILCYVSEMMSQEVKQ